MNDVSFII